MVQALKPTNEHWRGDHMVVEGDQAHVGIQSVKDDVLAVLSQMKV